MKINLIKKLFTSISLLTLLLSISATPVFAACNPPCAANERCKSFPLPDGTTKESCVKNVPNAAAGFNLGDFFKLGKTNQNVIDVYDTPASLLNIVVRNIFVIAGLLLFGTIIFAGFKIISGGSKGYEEAKNIITIAVTGFLIMFAAYWIVQIVEVVTGVPILL